MADHIFLPPRGPRTTRRHSPERTREKLELRPYFQRVEGWGQDRDPTALRESS